MSDHRTDHLFRNASRWPTKRRGGKRIENSTALKSILNLLTERQTVYRPSCLVWESMIIAFAQGAKQNESRWELVKQAFFNLSQDVPNYWPDDDLLRHGFHACEALGDTKLAADLISRRLACNDPAKSRIPFFILKNYLNLCLTYRDIDVFKQLLVAIDPKRAQFTKHNEIELFELGIKGFASLGDPKAAQTLLMTSIGLGLQLR